MVSFLIIIVFVVGFSIFYSKQRKKKTATGEFPQRWRSILDTKVTFFHNLSAPDKIRFERDVMRFIANVPITGVHTEVDITDKLLVASSAVIPVFGFPGWDYTFLDEVLLYPASFDRQYNINSPDETITGMVGSGTMEGKMILSKPALHRGFDNQTDKENVGIHEFIHLLDKEDGVIDGIPATLKGKEYALPWLDLIRTKSQSIIKGHSDINEYGATDQREFLAVAGEYFFERPQLLQKNHPDLYALLAQAFQQDAASVLKTLAPKRAGVERNDPCPCGSGKKFKNCCK
ncbi:MAG TPA: zinc-dependent peptidase [Chryseolinea sp.]|nr:zinc-dependent peptidase [Chryseolinea sp.]